MFLKLPGWEKKGEVTLQLIWGCSQPDTVLNSFEAVLNDV